MQAARNKIIEHHNIKLLVSTGKGRPQSGCADMARGAPQGRFCPAGSKEWHWSKIGRAAAATAFTGADQGPTAGVCVH